MRQGTDFIYPVLVAAIGGEQMVHRLSRADIRNHRVRAYDLSFCSLHSDDPTVLNQNLLDFGVRPRFAPRLRDRGNDMLRKGPASAFGIPCAAFQVGACYEGMDGKTCLAGTAAMVEPLRGKGRREGWIVRDVVDHLLRRPHAPAFDGVAVPPFQRRANEPGHRAGRGDFDDGFPALLQRGDPCIDGLCLVREPVLEVARLSLVGARQRQRRGVANMQIVIDGAHRGQLDRCVRQPIQNAPFPIFRRDTVQIVDARIPMKPFHGEAVAQPAKRLVLFEQKHLVPGFGQGGRGRHAPHAGADDDGVPVFCFNVCHDGFSPSGKTRPVAPARTSLAATSCKATTFNSGSRPFMRRVFAKDAGSALTDAMASQVAEVFAASSNLEASMSHSSKPWRQKNNRPFQMAASD